MFYQVLFENAPELKSLFHHHEAQNFMFVTALRNIFEGVPVGSNMDQYLMVLGKHHRGLGITKDHMAIGRRAFEAALSAGGITEISDKNKYLDSYDAIGLSMFSEA